MATSNNPSPSDQPSFGRGSEAESLATALSNLMPLLMRIQAQRGGSDPYASGIGAHVSPNPALDHVAAVSLIEDICTDRLCKLSRYLDRNGSGYSALETCTAIVNQATQTLTVRDYGQTFALIWHAYRLLTTLRAIDPSLPTLNDTSDDRSTTGEAAMH